MLGHTTIGTQDMDRAVAFYDALLEEIGAKQLFELGATDEGPPGERMQVFYGADRRDLDANKLCFSETKFGRAT